MCFNKWVLVIFFAFSVVMADVTPFSYSGNYCGDLEKKIWSIMVQKQDNDSIQLLPILFSECSMRGCDASVMIADINNKRGTIDREAILDRGFNFIATIKDEVEETCPGLVVSFSDVLALATRDAIVMAGGPYYPVLTGRRDSEETFFDKAMAEEWLSMVMFLISYIYIGGHNIGEIGREFIRRRKSNFMVGTALPDSPIPCKYIEDFKKNINKFFSERRRLCESVLSSHVLAGFEA